MLAPLEADTELGVRHLHVLASDGVTCICVMQTQLHSACWMASHQMAACTPLEMSKSQGCTCVVLLAVLLLNLTFVLLDWVSDEVICIVVA